MASIHPTPEEVGFLVGRLVKLLIENGADVNWTNLNSISALWHAVYNVRCDIAQYLLSKGADVNIVRGLMELTSNQKMIDILKRYGVKGST